MMVIKRYLTSILVFIMFYVSNDTFLFGTNEDENYQVSKYAIYVFLVLFLLIKNNFLFFLKPDIFTRYFIWLSLVLIASGLLNGEFSGGYAYQILVMLLAALFMRNISHDEFIFYYTKYLKFFCKSSLIIYGITLFIPNLLSYFPVLTNSLGAEYYNLFVGVAFKDTGIIRNTGIFREPGVFMIYILFGMVFEIYKRPQINYKIILLYLLALLLTFSTAAYIILAVLLLSVLFKTNSKSNFKLKHIVVLICVVGVVVILYNAKLNEMVFGKLSSTSIETGSSLARSASISVNYDIFSKNIISGVGIKNYQETFESISFSNYGVVLDTGNNTNTIMTVLAIYGVFFGILFIYLVIRLSYSFSSNRIVSLLLLFSVVLMLFNEELRFSLFIWVMLFFGLISKNKVEVQ